MNKEKRFQQKLKNEAPYITKFMKLVQRADLTDRNDFTKVVQRLIDDRKHAVLDNEVGDYLFDELIQLKKKALELKSIHQHEYGPQIQQRKKSSSTSSAKKRKSDKQNEIKKKQQQELKNFRTSGDRSSSNGNTANKRNKKKYHSFSYYDDDDDETQMKSFKRYNKKN